MPIISSRQALAATVRWLEQNQWKLDGERFGALLAGEPLARTKGETRRRVRDMIQEGDTRDLLDRLSLLALPFDLDMVWALAATGQTIPRARERFDDLIGPWIQPLGGTLFEVSPLLQDAGSTYLPPGLQREIHRAIAWQYLTVKSIPANHAIQISIHLFKAEDWQGLATALINLLLAVQTPQQARHLELMRFYFRPEKEWPTPITLSQRIIIRALQVRLLLLSGKSDDLYDTDLEDLIATATSEEAFAVLIARIHTGPFLEQVGPETTARRAVQASRAYRQVEKQLPESLPMAPEMLFWAAIGKLKEPEDVQAVVRVFQSMTNKERRLALTTQPGPQMAMFLAELCYASVAETELVNRDWTMALRLLDELEEVGRIEGGEPLFVAARRARAIALADYLDRTDEALELLQEPPGKLGEAPMFVLKFTTASILLAKGRVDEAFSIFLEAITLNARQEYPFLFYDALRRGMQAAARTEHWQEAITWCRWGMALAIGGEGMDPYEYLELMGELGWIHWCMGQRRKACAAMHGVVRGLMAMERVDDSRYKETFFKVGHVLGWLASSAAKGLPPSATANGDAYAAPYPGMLCTRKPGVAEWDSTPRVPILLYQLAMMAVGVGSFRLAKSTYSLVIQTANAEGLVALSCSAHMDLAPVEAYLGNFGEAFGAAIVGMQVLAASPQLEGSKSIVDERLDPVAGWRRLTPAERGPIESFAFFHTALLPAFVGILGRYKSDETALESLGRMEAAMAGVADELTQWVRWNQLIECMNLAFRRDSPRAQILSKINSIKSDDTYERVILYMALAGARDATLREALNAQAVVLIYVDDLGALDALLRQAVSHWIVKFWHREAAERAFRLSCPILLRQELLKVPASSLATSDAARLLLAAETAAAASLDKTVRERISQISRRQ